MTNQYLEERFWNKVDRFEPNKCWLWMAYVRKDGYGEFMLNGRCLPASRVSWFLTHGRHSKKHVLHKCDNRRCVNPDHLYEGTQKDNVMDMINRKRHWAQKNNRCHRGHEYNAINTRIYKGRRYCRPCQNKWRTEKYWSNPKLARKKANKYSKAWDIKYPEKRRKIWQRYNAKIRGIIIKP